MARRRELSRKGGKSKEKDSSFIMKKEISKGYKGRYEGLLSSEKEIVIGKSPNYTSRYK